MPDDLLYEVISNLDDYETNPAMADRHSCEVIRREKGLTSDNDNYWLFEEARVRQDEPDWFSAENDNDDWL